MVLGVTTAFWMLAGGLSAVPVGSDAMRPVPSIEFKHVLRIAIDPGHGGSNNGCLGVDGTYEKTVVLQIAERIEAILLEESNAVTLLTRNTDTHLGLGERSRLANAWKADIFISLHLNADAYGAGFGVETWFLGAEAADAEAKKLVETEEARYGEATTSEEATEDTIQLILKDASLRMAQAGSQALAIELAQALQTSTKRSLRGVKQAPFGVLKGAKMPAVVIEAGFFTHAKEGWMLLTAGEQDHIARGIVNGLLRYDRRIGGTRGQASFGTTPPRH